MLELIDYGLRILPGVAVLGMLYLLFRGNRDASLPILVLVLGFVLVRDAMTPAGFWKFGASHGIVPWIRFTDDPVVLAILGGSSLALVYVIVTASGELREYLEWGPLDVRALLFGFAGAVAIVMPLVAIYQFVPVGERGGAVSATLVPAILWMALAGNLAEEVLFRGYLQGYLETLYDPVRALLGSALFFAAGHVYLATTVTSLGPAIVVFTLYEGLVCASLRMRRGVWPAAVAHGVAIFALASGLF